MVRIGWLGLECRNKKEKKFIEKEKNGYIQLKHYL